MGSLPVKLLPFREVTELAGNQYGRFCKSKHVNSDVCVCVCVGGGGGGGGSCIRAYRRA